MGGVRKRFAQFCGESARSRLEDYRAKCCSGGSGLRVVVIAGQHPGEHTSVRTARRIEALAEGAARDALELTLVPFANIDGHRAGHTRETADHSLPYTIAVALANGALKSGDYAADRLADPALKRLMDKVEVEISESMTQAYPGRVQTRIAVRSTDGAEVAHLQQVPKGHATNPLTDAELERKFIDLYAPWGDEAAARRTLALAWTLDRLERVDPLVDALCGG